MPGPTTPIVKSFLEELHKVLRTGSFVDSCADKGLEIVGVYDPSYLDEIEIQVQTTKGPLLLKVKLLEYTPGGWRSGTTPR